MFGGGADSGREFKKLKQNYLNYLEAYKSLNNGSTQGATPFAQFYILMTYTSRYGDQRTLASLGYK